MPARRTLASALLALSLIAGCLVAKKVQARELTHEVRSGQYLSLIARRYHTSAQAIQKHNHLRKGQTLRPGMVLKIVETPAHRRWQSFLDAKKKATDDAKRKKEAQKKKAAEAKRKAAEARKKRAAEAVAARKRAQDRAAAQKRAAEKRVAEKRASAKRAKARKPSPPKPKAAKPKPRQASAKASKRESAPFSRRPRKPGRLRLVRHREVMTVQLVDDDGKLVTKNLSRVQRLLRSLRTGKKHDIDAQLLRNLAVISDHFGGRTIVVISGYRPPSPKQFTKNSRHNHGKAIDFKIIGVPHQVVFDRCRELSNVGCGLYPNSHFVHMDVRSRKTQWTDMSFPGQAPRYVRKKKPAPKERKVAGRKASKHRPSQ